MALSLVKWNKRWIAMAELVASWSKDPSTKVGCVIVDPNGQNLVSIGFNGFPRGVAEEKAYQVLPIGSNFTVLDQCRWSRPDKYQWVVHAELNAILNAARSGRSTIGCWAYMNFEPHPCENCAGALVQAGITKIIGPSKPWPGNGTGAPYTVSGISKTILREGGIDTLEVEL